MKHYIDPANAIEAQSRLRELEAESAHYFLWIWEVFEFTKDGLTYYVEVDGHVIREGERGPISISDELRFKSIELNPDPSVYQDGFKIDQEHFQVNHGILFHMLESAIDLKILEYAKKSDRWEQE